MNQQVAMDMAMAQKKQLECQNRSLEVLLVTVTEKVIVLYF